MLGLTNCAATIPGFVGPQVVGILTNENVSLYMSGDENNSFIQFIRTLNYMWIFLFGGGVGWGVSFCK